MLAYPGTASRQRRAHVRLWRLERQVTELVAQTDISRFSCMQFLSVPGVNDYATRRLALASARVWPSPSGNEVGFPI